MQRTSKMTSFPNLFFEIKNVLYFKISILFLDLVVKISQKMIGRLLSTVVLNTQWNIRKCQFRQKIFSVLRKRKSNSFSSIFFSRQFFLNKMNVLVSQIDSVFSNHQLIPMERMIRMIWALLLLRLPSIPL